MSFGYRQKEESIWMNQSPIICEQQNLEELILQKQKQLVLMEQSNNCLKQEMSQQNKLISNLSQQIDYLTSTNEQLNQTVFDLQQKIAQNKQNQADYAKKDKQNKQISELLVTLQQYKQSILQLEQFHKIQLHNFRISYEQKISNLNGQMQSLKLQKKSQLGYYLNIIGQMQKEIQLLRDLNQFCQKNSSIQVKQLKFQKSTDSLEKSEQEAFNLFQQTIKIVKPNHFIQNQEESQIYQNNFNRYTFNGKQEFIKKNKEQNLKSVQNYQKHLILLKEQIQNNKKSKKSNAYIANNILNKQKYRNKSIQAPKIIKEKSTSYLKKYILSLNQGQYKYSKNFLESNEIDKKLKLIKDNLSKQLSQAYE